MNEVLRDYRLRSLTVCQVRLTFEGWRPDVKGQGQVQEVQVGKVSTSGSSGLPGKSSIGSLLTLNKKKRNINGSRKLGKNDLTQEELMNTNTNPVGHLLILTCDRILLLQDKGCEGDDSFTLTGDHAHHRKDGEPQRLAPLVSGANEIFLSISLSQIVQVELCESGYGVEVEYADPSSKYSKNQCPLNDTDSDNDQSAEYGFPSSERFPILSALVSGARDALKRKLGSLSGKVSGSLQRERSLDGNVVRIVLHTKSLHTARNLKDAIQSTCRRFLEALLWLDRGLPTTVESVLTVATVSARYASRLGDIVLGRGFAWGETLRISGEPVCICVDLSTPLGARSCEIQCVGKQETAILATEVQRLVLKTSKPNPRRGVGQEDKDHMVVYITVELFYSEQSVVGTPKETQMEMARKVVHPAMLDALPVRVVWNHINQNEVEVLLFIISVLVLFVSMLSLRPGFVSWLTVAVLATNMVLSSLRIILRWARCQQSHSPFDWKTKQNHTDVSSNDQRKETYILLKFVRAEIVEDVHKANELAEPSSINFSAELFETNAMIKDELPPIARKLSRTMSLPKALLMVEEHGPEDEGLIDIGAIAGSQRLVVSSPHGQNLTIFKTSSDSTRDETGESNRRLQDIDGNLRPLTPQASHTLNSLESFPERKKLQQSVDLSVSMVTEESLRALNVSRKIADLTEISPYITEDLFHRYLFACGGDSDMALDRLKATAVGCVICFSLVFTLKTSTPFLPSSLYLIINRYLYKSTGMESRKRHRQDSPLADP